ncbi:alpha/beta hydrolase [Saccharopolyspora gloriosae]|uniref:alpha/beta hydrolase n=1 Tax=Saccharopolyspora gloriosae TaxID=455344 RepID=UPI001FB65904|nr:alpha/beta hydrolase [Saccharopolyspora gloriosae]
MVNIGDLRRWNPDLLDDAIDDLKREQNRLVSLDDELANSGRPKEWHGKAANSATAEHGKLGERLRELVVEVSTVRSATIATADEIREIGHELTEAEALAHSHHFLIGDDGKIEDLGTPPGIHPDEAQSVNEDRNNHIRPDLADRVKRILDRATDTDREFAKVLGDADRDLMDTRGSHNLAEAAALGDARGLGETLEPPPPGDAKQNAEWWKSLPAETKSALATAPPAWLGNMDGIPGSVRSTANINRIDDERSTLQAEATRLRNEIKALPKGPGSRNLQTKYTLPLRDVEAKLKSLDQVESTLDRGNRQLLLLDTSGERTKAAVGIGDVDTAEHVTVFTPGMNSTVEGSIGDYDKSMDSLRREAKQQSYDYGDGGDVATVTWLGYEAPQGSEMLDPSTSVAGSAAAQRGATDLSGFYRGINESRTDDPHLVAMGHSYGSTTTGYALQREDVGVDAAVTMGSPGVGTGDRSDINVPGGWMYNLESTWDPVADIGRFGGDPSKNPQIDQLSTSEAVSPDGQRLKESSGHGTGGPTGYLTPGTTSQYNAGSIAADVPDLAVQASRY